MKRIWGVFVFLFGLALAAWVGYNLLIERLPETKGMNPLPAIVLSAACLFVGYKRIRGQQGG